MAIKKLIEVWDGENLLKDNITFLKKTTKEVHLPLSDNNQNILDDLLDTFKNPMESEDYALSNGFRMGLWRSILRQLHPFKVRNIFSQRHFLKFLENSYEKIREDIEAVFSDSGI